MTLIMLETKAGRGRKGTDVGGGRKGRENCGRGLVIKYNDMPSTQLYSPDRGLGITHVFP